MLTPSSNTVLEPYTSQLFSTYANACSVHFSRFKVTDISLSEKSIQQFDHDAILSAAQRLAEAKVDVIAWNGTAAAWLGMEQDEVLCARITAETGIAATSTMAAFAAAVDVFKARKLALITPYQTDIQKKIISRYAAQGFSVVHEQHLGDSGNFSFAEYTTDKIRKLALQSAAENPDAILIVCTNFRGAPIAQEVEQLAGIPVIDSVSVTAWMTLQMVGLDTSSIKGWGQLFAKSR